MIRLFYLYIHRLDRKYSYCTKNRLSAGKKVYLGPRGRFELANRYRQTARVPGWRRRLCRRRVRSLPPAAARAATRAIAMTCPRPPARSPRSTCNVTSSTLSQASMISIVVYRIHPRESSCKDKLTIRTTVQCIL